MLATLSILAVLAVQSDPESILLTKNKLDCRDWSEVANYYIGLGEQDACVNLLKAAEAGKKKQNRRVTLICRILFEGKNKSALRPPSLGSLSLPSFPLSAWPQFPLFEQDEVWFLLDENYVLEEHPEAASKYLDYCRQNGVFRTERLKVPNQPEAVDALKALQVTKRWKGIRWSDSGINTSSTYHAEWTLELLKSQTHFSDGP